jgi:hypothetical protein
MSTGPYDPCEEFVDDRDDDDTDLEDFDAGIDESPDVNDDGEIVSSSSDEEVRDFAAEDDRDVSDDDEDTTETRKTTLDQEGLDGENIFAGSNDENTGGINPYDPTGEFEDQPDGTVKVAENLGGADVDVYREDDANPGRVPEDRREEEVHFAEAVLDYAVGREGHQSKVIGDIRDWSPSTLPNEDVEVPDYYGAAAYALTPGEVNFGNIKNTDNIEKYERYKKARTVIAWASDRYPADDLRTVERELAEEKAKEEEEARKAQEAIEKAEAWADSPPHEYNGWVQFNSDNLMHDDVVTAYVGVPEHGPTVALLYDDPDTEYVKGGMYDVEEFSRHDDSPKELRKWDVISPPSLDLDIDDEYVEAHNELRKTLESHEADSDADMGEIYDSMMVEEASTDGEREESKNPIEVEFGAKDVADDIRSEHEDYLCSLDDRRLKTVRFVQDTPDEVLEDARAAAVETRADKTKDSYGQMGLTEREKGEIDFSENSVFHARTAKAIAAGEGVSNWLDYYDPTLTTDEHIEVYKNAEAASRLDSDELDDETVDEKLAEMEKTAESEECDHAERGCKDGYEEACEFLVKECGVDEGRVDNLLDEDDFEDVDADGAREAREYAGIINAVRQELGQDLLEFEPAGEFDGGVVDPDDVGADFDASGLTPYDPTEDIAI